VPSRKVVALPDLNLFARSFQSAFVRMSANISFVPRYSSFTSSDVDLSREYRSFTVDVHTASSYPRLSPTAYKCCCLCMRPSTCSFLWLFPQGAPESLLGYEHFAEGLDIRPPQSIEPPIFAFMIGRLLMIRQSSKTIPRCSFCFPHRSPSLHASTK